MNGFLKRDLSLIQVNLSLYIYLAILAVFLLFIRNTAMASMYLLIFSASSVMSLFNYDEVNHWQGYAAAAPNGRKAMVDARYLLCAAVAVVVFAGQFLLGLWDRSLHPEMTFLYGELFFLYNALLYSGVFLLYAAVILPVFYHFGGTKARLIMIVAVAALAGLFAAVVLMPHGQLPLPSFLPALFPLLSAAILALSHRISRRIMAKKEL